MGYGESKTYYHTIAEVTTLQGAALTQRMRVGGTVEPGSIKRLTGRFSFSRSTNHTPRETLDATRFHGTSDTHALRQCRALQRRYFRDRG